MKIRPGAAWVLIPSDSADDAAQILNPLKVEPLVARVRAVGERCPDLDGVTLTRKLKLKATPLLADIPVLMLTGGARREALASSMSVAPRPP